jgi:hypothetical protein
MAVPSGELLIVLVHEVAVDDAEKQRLAEQRRIMLASHTAFTTAVFAGAGGDSAESSIPPPPSTMPR